MNILPEDLLKLLLAILVGGVIGAEREYHNKAAGFRTLIFISLGSALFTIFSIKIATDSDPARIAAQIVTGVGFIGGGVIMRDSGRIHGLTTAAMIWLVAALGLGIGIGQYAFTGIVTLCTLIVLLLFPTLEHAIDNLRDERTYEITCLATHYNALQSLLQTHKLRAAARTHRSGESMTITWIISAAPGKHEQLTKKLLSDSDIQKLSF